MAKKRRNVIIGLNHEETPIYKQLLEADPEEMNLKLIQSYIENGAFFILIPGTAVLSKMQKNSMILEEYAEKWLSRKRKLKQNTIVRYKKNLEEYILPCLGEKVLEDISVEDVQAMMDRYSHLAQKTINGALTVLSQIMKYAVSDGLIKKNPCDSYDLQIPSDRKTEREALPIDQYKDILANLHMLNKCDQRYMGLLMYTGMRRGEALGLRWEDIDLKNNLIHISRNVTHPQQNAPIVTTPKTKASIRSIPIDDNLMKLLRPIEKTGYILSGEKPITLSSYRNMMKRINKTINLYGATAHVLRHSYLTYAVGETTDFKTIQGISGHADIGTLLNRYAHPQDKKIKKLSKMMHNILNLS